MKERERDAFFFPITLLTLLIIEFKGLNFCEEEKWKVYIRGPDRCMLLCSTTMIRGRNRERKKAKKRQREK